MKCPSCGNDKTRVIDTRKFQTVNIRTRVCDDCGQVWKTAEIVHAVYEREVVTYEITK